METRNVMLFKRKKNSGTDLRNDEPNPESHNTI